MHVASHMSYDWRLDCECIKPAGRREKQEAELGRASGPSRQRSREDDTPRLSSNNGSSPWVKMANTNMPDDVQEPRLEHTAHTMEGTDQADGQPTPSAPDVFPLFEIIDEFVAQHPVLQGVTTPRETRVCLVSDVKHRVERDLTSMHSMMRSGAVNLLHRTSTQNYTTRYALDTPAQLMQNFWRNMSFAWLT
jgi:hypothetical protein